MAPRPKDTQHKEVSGNYQGVVIKNNVKNPPGIGLKKKSAREETYQNEVLRS